MWTLTAGADPPRAASPEEPLLSTVSNSTMHLGRICQHFAFLSRGGGDCKKCGLLRWRCPLPSPLPGLPTPAATDLGGEQRLRAQAVITQQPAVRAGGRRLSGSRQ